MGGWLFAHCRASRQWHAPGGEDIEILILLVGSIWCSFCGSVVLWFCGSVVLWFCGSVVCVSIACWIILWKDMGASRGMNKIMWRYGLTGNRPAATSGRFRDEALRCVVTRRLTSRTCVVSGSANREKTGSMMVKIKHNWPVFQCTVDWARARLKTALIAGGAAASRGIYSAGVII